MVEADAVVAKSHQMNHPEVPMLRMKVQAVPNGFVRLDFGNVVVAYGFRRLDVRNVAELLASCMSTVAVARGFARCCFGNVAVADGFVGVDFGNVRVVVSSLEMYLSLMSCGLQDHPKRCECT